MLQFLAAEVSWNCARRHKSVLKQNGELLVSVAVKKKLIIRNQMTQV